MYLAWTGLRGPSVPALCSTCCILSASCEILTASSSMSESAVYPFFSFFFKEERFDTDQWADLDLILNHRVCVLTLAKRGKKVESSPPPPIDGPAEKRRTGFILHNAPGNFTAQPEPNQFPARAENFKEVATFLLRLGRHPPTPLVVLKGRYKSHLTFHCGMQSIHFFHSFDLQIISY